MPEQPNEAQVAVALVNRLLGGKQRANFLRMVKAEVPTAPIPEIDAAQPYVAVLQALNRELQAVKKRLDDGDADGKIAKGFDTLQRDRGYMDDAITEIKKRMVEKNIGDITAAADHYDAEKARSQPPKPIEPSAFSDFGGNLVDNEGELMKKWFENPDKMLDNEIGAVLAESRAGRLVG